MIDTPADAAASATTIPDRTAAQNSRWTATGIAGRPPIVTQHLANARGHFPTEQAALKCVYLAIMSLDPKGTGQKRWSNRWKSALNAFEITFDGRLSLGRK